jgi:hypothetical protein
LIPTQVVVRMGSILIDQMRTRVQSHFCRIF